MGQPRQVVFLYEMAGTSDKADTFERDALLVALCWSDEETYFTQTLLFVAVFFSVVFSGLF